MRRLYLQIYAALPGTQGQRTLDGVGTLLGELLPTAHRRKLLPDTVRPALRTRLAQDIAELDALLDELLLASRLDTLHHVERLEEVDLLALLAEEGTRVGAEVNGASMCLQGEPHMLRRLMRNLLENAQR